MSAPGWLRLFPLIRRLSDFLRPLILLTPLTPNQATVISLASGLAAAWSLAVARDQGAMILAAILLLVSYLFDQWDGDIARAKSLHSRFGHHFDTFVDWLVNALFFLALGWGETARSGAGIWTWLGLAAFLGASVNYALVLRHEYQNRDLEAKETPPMAPDLRGPGDLAVYLLREVFRADFCFIVLSLALVDLLWVLLPLGALGAQAYWLLALTARARRFHV